MAAINQKDICNIYPNFEALSDPATSKFVNPTENISKTKISIIMATIIQIISIKETYEA